MNGPEFSIIIPICFLRISYLFLWLTCCMSCWLFRGLGGCAAVRSRAFEILIFKLRTNALLDLLLTWCMYKPGSASCRHSWGVFADNHEHRQGHRVWGCHCGRLSAQIFPDHKRRLLYVLRCAACAFQVLACWKVFLVSCVSKRPLLPTQHPLGARHRHSIPLGAAGAFGMATRVRRESRVLGIRGCSSLP